MICNRQIQKGFQSNKSTNLNRDRQTYMSLLIRYQHSLKIYLMVYEIWSQIHDDSRIAYHSIREIQIYETYLLLQDQTQSIKKQIREQTQNYNANIWKGFQSNQFKTTSISFKTSFGTPYYQMVVLLISIITCVQKERSRQPLPLLLAFS